MENKRDKQMIILTSNEVAAFTFIFGWTPKPESQEYTPIFVEILQNDEPVKATEKITEDDLFSECFSD